MATQANPISWFEIPVRDLGRAKAFYEHVLGVQLSLQEVGTLQMAFFPMHRNASGASGSLVQASYYDPSHAGTLVYFAVSSIEQTLKRVEDKGGKVLSTKSSIGEYGFIARFEDSEGNRVALHAMR